MNSNELIGSDFKLKLNNNLLDNPENEPRVIGRYILSNKNNTKMKNIHAHSSVFLDFLFSFHDVLEFEFLFHGNVR